MPLLIKVEADVVLEKRFKIKGDAYLIILGYLLKQPEGFDVDFA